MMPDVLHAHTDSWSSSLPRLFRVNHFFLSSSVCWGLLPDSSTSWRSIVLGWPGFFLCPAPRLIMSGSSDDDDKHTGSGSGSGSSSGDDSSSSSSSSSSSDDDDGWSSDGDADGGNAEQLEPFVFIKVTCSAGCGAAVAESLDFGGGGGGDGDGSATNDLPVAEFDKATRQVWHNTDARGVRDVGTNARGEDFFTAAIRLSPEKRAGLSALPNVVRLA